MQKHSSITKSNTQFCVLGQNLHAYLVILYGLKENSRKRAHPWWNAQIRSFSYFRYAQILTYFELFHHHTCYVPSTVSPSFIDNFFLSLTVMGIPSPSAPSATSPAAPPSVSAGVRSSSTPDAIPFPMFVSVNSDSPSPKKKDNKKRLKTYVSLRLRVQNAVSAQPCVGKFRISLVLLNFLHCNFRLWFETP